jgi:uncharacterized protein
MVKDFSHATKRVYDPVHGFIHFDEHEKKLIDSFPFQRLHYIHQLGMAYFVYPGATHTRFEHSFGVMELSSRIYRQLCRTLRPDLFHFIPRKGSLEYVYWEKVLRMAALCHDLGHLPFSHVAEKTFLGTVGHEKLTVDLICSPYLKEVWEQLDETPLFQTEKKGSIRDDVVKIAIGEKKYQELFSTNTSFSSWEKILSQIITADFFGADRMDYLLRDSRGTGIVYGLFDYQQLIECLRILPSLQSSQKDSLELGIDENGLESCEALLLARHFMHRRVYQYSTIQSYNFHMRRFFKATYSKKDFLGNLDKLLMTNDSGVVVELHKAAYDSAHPGHDDAKRIVFRKDLFKAISISSIVDEAELLAFKRKHSIQEEQMQWQFITNEERERMGPKFSFPVSSSHFQLCMAEQCSSLLLKIPSHLSNWVFIAPEFELLFLEMLNRSTSRSENPKRP